MKPYYLFALSSAQFLRVKLSQSENRKSRESTQGDRESAQSRDFSR